MADSISARRAALIGEYTKFMLLRLVVLMTIVLTLLNGKSNISEKLRSDVDTVAATSYVTQDDYRLDDYFLEAVLFQKRDRSQADDSGLALNIVQAKFPGLTLDSIQNHVEVISYLKKLGEDASARIKANSGSAFQVKVPAIADATLDLRIWIWVFPLLYALAALYAFILKQNIKAAFYKQKLWGTDAEKAELYELDYPYKYLKRVFEMMNLVLVILFLYAISFLVTGRPHWNEVSLIATPYFILLFYTVAYGVYVGRAITRKQMGAEYIESRIYLFWNGLLHVARRRLGRLKATYSFGLGTTMLLLTLFLTMSEANCNSEKYRGYQLLTRFSTTSWQVNTFSESWADHHLVRIYQVCYSLLFLSLPLLFWVVRGMKTGGRTRYGAKMSLGLFNFYVASFVLFTTYFGLHTEMTPEAWTLFAASVIYAAWFRITSHEGSAGWGNRDIVFIVNTLVLCCCPFILLGIRHCLPSLLEDITNAWIWLYMSLCLLLLTAAKGARFYLE